MRSLDFWYSLLGRWESPDEAAVPLIDLMTLEDRVLYSLGPMIDPAMLADAQPPPDAQQVDAAAIDAAVTQADVTLPDASAATTLDAAPEATPESTTEPTQSPAPEAPDADTERVELVVVGPDITDLDQVLADLRQSSPERKLEVVLLNADEDGFAQLDRAFDGDTTYSAVHFLTHGDDVMFRLGNTWFDQAGVEAHQLQISHWADSLTADADLLFYGCDLASNHDGKLLIERIHDLTGADVAASDDATGLAARGGDWDLEVRFGAVETETAVSSSLQHSWDGILATYTVTNTNDSGAGSLRQAILDANANAGLDTIDFNIGGGGAQVIAPVSDLPFITDAVILDATTQPGYAGSPLIGLDGSSAAGSTAGLWVEAGGSTIRGLAIYSFGDDGIELNNTSGFAHNNVIENNWIGLRTDGTAAGNVDNGVLLNNGATNNNIRNNVISGNGSNGILFHDAGTNDNVVTGNIIGLNPAGTAILGNGLNGVRIHTGASNNVIGGAFASLRNVISGNGNEGVFIAGSGTNGNIVQGNYVGTDITGLIDLGNLEDGIEVDSGAANTIIGGAAAGEGNVIAGNDDENVSLNGASTGTIVRGNYIGVGADGVTALGSGQYALEILGDSADNVIGGTIAGEGNLIANSPTHGVYIQGAGSTNNTVIGNSIYNNAELGINLQGGTEDSFDVTANDAGDADTGANSLQNFPVIAQVVSNGSRTRISGAFNSTASTAATLHFYSNPAADPSGYGEGRIYLGSVDVTTDGSGNATWFVELSAGVTAGQVVTATATTAGVGTSEFSAAVAAVGEYGLWISTLNGATATAGGVTSWTDSGVVRLSDPNLTLGTGTSNGTFSDVFDIDNFAADGSADLIGLDIVNRTVVVGVTNPLTLQAGDILFSTAANETFGGVAVTSQDIVLYRPTAPGDYSGGTFSIFMLQPGSTGAKIREFALVESPITVGGTLLQAGDLLITFSSATYDKDVRLFRPDVMSSTADTTGTLTELIDGASSGISFSQQIYGLELVQEATSLGGQTLSAGQLLIALNGDETVASNALAVTRNDVFALTVTATGTGTSSGTANFLFRGTDVGITGDAERYDALALVATPAGVPVLGLDSANLVTNGSFESGSTGWTGNAGVEVSGTIGTYGISSLGSGSFFAEVEGAGLAPTSTPSYLQQTIATQAGETYIFQLQAHTRTGSNVGDRGQLVVDGVVVAEFVTDNSWQSFAAEFTATGASTTIRIVSQGSASGSVAPGDGVGLLVDDVQVRAVDRTVAFTENGSAVAVAVAGSTIVDNDSANLNSATVTLTNPQTGDRLLVNGSSAASGTLASGIGWTRTDSLVVLSGSYSKANYNSALQLVQYESQSDDPSTAQRVISVQVSDGDSNSNLAEVTVNVTAVNDAPVNSVPGLQNMNEDGTLVFNSGAGNLISISDVDVGGGNVQVTLAATNGTLTLSGLTGLSFTTGDGSADANMQFSGTLANVNTALNGMTFTAAGNYTGGAGIGITTSDLGNSGTGGAQTDNDGVSIIVAAVNDAPALDNTGNMSLASVSENNTSSVTVASLVAGAGGDRITDVDSGAVEGIAVIAANNGNGAWRYSTDGGSNYFAFGSVSNTTALLLRATDLVAYYGDGLNGGTADFTFRAWDQTSGSAGSFVDASVNGGTTAFSTATESASITTTSVNDAPVLDSTASPTLTAEAEDAGAPVGAVGTLVSALVDFSGGGGNNNVSDVDTGATLGVAVTAADSANGTWYYSINGGANWNALGAVTNANARLLAADANTRLYFQPNADYAGTLASAITFRAWDQTSGANGGTASTATNGGTTAFSTATDTAALTVTGVNDPPVITSNGGGASASVNVAENSTAVTTVTSSDIDGGTPIYSISGGADAAFFGIDSSTGALTFNSARDYEAPADAGGNNVYDVIVQVGDGAGGTDTQAIAVTVTNQNDNSPVITSNGGGAGAFIGVAENTTAVTTVTATDADAPAQTLTFTITGGADAARFNIGSGSGALVFATAPDYEAPTDSNADNVYYVIVQVSDGAGGTVTQAISVTVANGPDRPAGADQTLTMPEDGTQTLVAADFGFVDQDAGDSLTAVRIDTVPAAGSLTLLGVNVTAGQVVTAAEIAAGNLRFSPNPDANGAAYAALTFSVRDQSGLYDLTPNSLKFDVLAANDAPTIAPPADQTVNEDTTLGPLTITIGDVDNAPAGLMVSATSGDPSIIPNRNLILGGSGTNRTLTITPAADAFGGPVTIQLSVSDGVTTTFTSFLVTVSGVNDVPQIVVPAIAATEDTPLILTGTTAIVVADSDGPASIVTVTLGFDHGALTLASTAGLTFLTGDGSADAMLVFSGTVTDVNAALDGAVYLADADFFGVEQITFQIHDVYGATTSGVTTWNVVAVNDAPLAADDDFSTFTGQPLRILAPGLIGNAVDVESDPLTAAVVQGPSNGSLTLNLDGSFEYTPSSTFFGDDSFSYQVSDGGLSSTPAIVHIQVVPFAGAGSGGSSTGYGSSGNSGGSSSENTDSDSDSNSDAPTLAGVVATPAAPETRPRSSAGARGEVAAADGAGSAAAVGAANASGTVAEGIVLPLGIAGHRQHRGGPIARGEIGAEERRGPGAEVDWANVTETEVLDSLLNTLKEELQSEQEVRDLVATTAAASTAALTAGYALWALKSGHLLASLLAGMPAWRQFDPLPVVERYGKSDDDDESLVDIASQNHQV